MEFTVYQVLVLNLPAITEAITAGEAVASFSSKQKFPFDQSIPGLLKFLEAVQTKRITDEVQKLRNWESDISKDERRATRTLFSDYSKLKEQMRVNINERVTRIEPYEPGGSMNPNTVTPVTVMISSTKSPA